MSQIVCGHRSHFGLLKIIDFKLIAVDFSVLSSRNLSRKLENSQERVWNTFNNKIRDNNRISISFTFQTKAGPIVAAIQETL